MRTAVLATACSILTIASHSTAHGTIAYVGLALVAVLMGLLSIFVTSRQLSANALLGFLMGTQALSHFLLSVITPATGRMMMIAPGVPCPQMPGMSHGSAAGMNVMADAGMLERLQLTPQMLLAHTVAAAAVAVVLLPGERLYFRLHRTLPAVLRVLLGVMVHRLEPLAAVPARIVWTIRTSVRQLYSTIVALGDPLRGPPLIAVS